MVPIYAMTSWMGMVCKNYAPGIAVFRDCYESLVLYSFYQFLIVALGGKTKLGDMLAFKPQVMHLWPCNQFMRPWPMGNRFLQLCAVGILQYIPCKIICAFVSVITESFGLYGNGQYTNIHMAYPWVTLVLNCSQMWALYCLALIYLGTKEELASIKPVAKFASIKLIIFFTWWQSICLSFAVELGLLDAQMFSLPSDHSWTQNNVAQALQDLFICYEMVIFAIAHHYIFSIPSPIDYDQTTRQDWESVSGAGFGEAEQTYLNLMTAVTLTDLVKDAQDVQKPVPMESYQSYLGRYMDNHKHVGSQGF
jgi:hypothetical protein